MTEQSKPTNSLKIGVFMFLFLLVVSVFFSVYKSTEAESKIDSRFTSYDNLFFQTKAIVLDSLGNKIGDIYIHTNEEEIESYYNDSTRRKTQFYHNLKSKKLRLKEK